MTISDNYVPTKTTGDGSTTVFTGGWPIFNDTYLRIYLENKTTGVQVLQTKDTDYSLTFTDSGWSVDFSISTPPPATEWVVGERAITQEQQTVYKTSSGFDGKVTENSYDVITAMIQELGDITDRSITFPVASGLVGVLPTPVDSQLLAWDGVGGTIKNISVTSLSDSLDTTITSLADNDVLVYNASGGVWQNQAGIGTTELQDNAVTGAKIAMGSDAQGDILYYNGSSYARLGAGTSGQLLQTQGAGANPVWATVSTDYILLATQTASNSAGISFTSNIDSTYSLYIIEGIDVVPASDGQDLRVTLSTDGGSNYLSSGYQYHRADFLSNNVNYQGSQSLSASHFSLVPATGSDTGEGCQFKLLIFNPSGATLKKSILGQSTYVDSSGNLNSSRSGGGNTTTSAVDAIKFAFASGAIESGTFKLYGVG